MIEFGCRSKIITEPFPEVVTSIGNAEIERLERLRVVINGKIAEALGEKMIHNSFVSWSNLFGNGRPLSAFYTHFRPHNPRNQQSIVIESGAIQENGEAKLHDFLRTEIRHDERVRIGHTVRSGHIASITIPYSDEIIRVALFDSLDKKYPLKVGKPEFPIVATLLKNNIIPITANGCPVKII
jgi:hypothetical protein